MHRLCQHKFWISSVPLLLLFGVTFHGLLVFHAFHEYVSFAEQTYAFDTRQLSSI